MMESNSETFWKSLQEEMNQVSCQNSHTESNTM